MLSCILYDKEEYIVKLILITQTIHTQQREARLPREDGRLSGLSALFFTHRQPCFNVETWRSRSKRKRRADGKSTRSHCESSWGWRTWIIMSLNLFSDESSASDQRDATRTLTSDIFPNAEPFITNAPALLHILNAYWSCGLNQKNP